MYVGIVFLLPEDYFYAYHSKKKIAKYFAIKFHTKCCTFYRIFLFAILQFFFSSIHLYSSANCVNRFLTIFQQWGSSVQSLRSTKTLWNFCSIILHIENYIQKWRNPTIVYAFLFDWRKLLKKFTNCFF